MKRFRVSQLVLALLCLMYFVTYLDRVNVSTAADGFSRDFQLNRTQIGLVFSAFAYPYLVFQIIGGWVSDRLGARRTLGNWELPFLGSMGLMGIGMLLALRRRPDNQFTTRDDRPGLTVRNATTDS